MAVMAVMTVAGAARQDSAPPGALQQPHLRPLPGGGAKGAAAVEPRALSTEARQDRSQRYAAGITPIVGPDQPRRAVARGAAAVGDGTSAHETAAPVRQPPQ